MKQQESIYRLRQKHAPRDADRQPTDALRLLGDQSIRSALMGGCLAAAILIFLWVAAGLLFDQFFPWFSLLIGFFVGRAVQHFGRGIDWRFPVIAALLTIIAAFLGSFLCALFLTAREFETGVFALLGDVSWHTLATFASREFGIVGSIYALMAASIAAFFAQRRLSRDEAIALRKHNTSRNDD